MKRHAAVILSVLFFVPLLIAEQRPKVITLDSCAPLLQLKLMVKAGSAADPEGVEGLAYLAGRMMIEGSFGDPKNPVTKDKLAEITRPWGEGAYPTVEVSKEVTTFSMTVPREAVSSYIRQVLQPMFTQPLFAAELDRLRAETLQNLRSNLRFEQIELVGLVALDNFIHENDSTGYAHPDIGTENGLEQVAGEAVRRFYRTYYRPENIVLGVSTADAAIVEQVRAAFASLGRREISVPAGRSTAAELARASLAMLEQLEPLPRRFVEVKTRVEGRQVLIVALPNAISTGLHAGFPLALTRKDKDYWPLYIANIWFGTHRDSFSHLYQVIREERGYNYGDYSYIEHFEDRPFHLFPPTNTPRRRQYFSIWIRPVQHEYAHHLIKALTWELENFIRTGLTQEQCALAKNKARVLYLSLAETTGRLLGSRLDDDFYGLEPGYLETYLKNIDAVSCGEVNPAIRAYLQAKNLKYVVVTSEAVAPELAAAIPADAPAWGKTPAEYQLEVKEQGGQKVYIVPEAKLRLLERDAAWAHYWLGIPKERISIVPAGKLFATAALPK